MLQFKKPKWVNLVIGYMINVYMKERKKELFNKEQQKNPLKFQDF